MEGSMDEAERVAREARSLCNPRVSALDFDPKAWPVTVTAARLGIEHGERANAEKIADMKRVLEYYAGVWGERKNNAAAECLSRNFPAPKPSLREAAQALEASAQFDWFDARKHAVVDRDAFFRWRDALAREGVKP